MRTLKIKNIFRHIQKRAKVSDTNRYKHKTAKRVCLFECLYPSLIRSNNSSSFRFIEAQ